MKNLIVVLFLTVLFACKTDSKQNSEPVSIEDDVVFLASDKLEGRQTGTDGEKAAAEYIAKRFENLGLEPKGTNGYFQAFSFKPQTDPHQKVNYTVKDGDSTITGTNVIGFLNNNAKNTIIIGAHYDHLGYGAEGSLYRGDTQEIHNGADDNASGVAVMLNLAKKLTSTNTGNNYLFMAFSGEEMGLLGSNYFTKNATIDLSKANYMINMDMVGRLKEDHTLAVYGVGTSPMLKQVVKANNSKFELVLNESGVGPSDHTSFYNSDIPVLHFFTGQHDDYHKPGDDTPKLNYEGMDMISSYIFDIISDLDNNGKLAFRTTKNESEVVPQFKVALGVIPDYLFSGKGMRIDGVSEGKAAQKAGLIKGDIVIKLGDSLITDMNSYMRALSSFEEGDKAKVRVKRGNDEVEKDIEFQKF